MTIVEADLLIRAPQIELFALAQDYDLRLKWDPFLRDMKFRDGATRAAVGVRVWVKAHNGFTMEIEYTTLKAPEVVAMKMIHGPFFFKQFAGTWRFKTLDSGPVQVTFRYAFTTRWAFFRPLVDPVIYRIFLHDIRGRLQGLKHGAEQTDLLNRLPVDSNTDAANRVAAQP
jgi:ribosome-associated toxin RatA of RatAB toxin-antitoxin module